ncbi:MAG: class I SAM-dependent methyltransferase [Thiomargarita sp.]|nr:class I SAM-dependent methyltransferase [Thiomargarita sp.]
MSALSRLNLNVQSINKLETQDISTTQKQTKSTFAFKWDKWQEHESAEMRAYSIKWMLERYCDTNPEKLKQWLTGEQKIILDAGCGSGYSASLFFGDYLKQHDYLGVDISNAIGIARNRFAKLEYPGDFLQEDIMNLPIADKVVDIIFSEGVLHHTDSTKQAIINLSQKLKKGGLFLFYVYAKKAVIREFTDDYIRESLSTLSDEEALATLKPLTKLGIALGELNIELEVPEDIPVLGIKRGKIDLQRFFYWNMCKMYYRPELSFDEMLITNYDWFSPLNCHRHTPDEIKAYCAQADLNIEHMNIQESGITVVARKIC